MSKEIFINRFDGGMAESRSSRAVGECSVVKHFDFSLYPYKLTPYRSLLTDETGQFKIGNLVTTSDGLVWGLGTNSGLTNGRVYKKASVGVGWSAISNGDAGTAIDYRCFKEYKNCLFFWGSSAVDLLFRTDISDVLGATSLSISYTTLGGMAVHPADDKLYFSYDNKVGSVNAVTATIANDVTTVALTLPDTTFTITDIVPYGNFLAIAGYKARGVESSVYLWDRTSATSVTEVIRWGPGKLEVLNNLQGVLVGVSIVGAGSEATTIQTYAAASIRGYAGGSTFLIRNIVAERNTTTAPTVTINNRVSIIYDDKFYFSISVVGGSTSPAYYGLWSLTKSKFNGQYVIGIENVATNSNTETGVLAAALISDFVYFVHTAVGTLTRFEAGVGYAATSIYESLVNPDMPEGDYQARKALKSVTIHTAPINTAGTSGTPQVVFKYRVDSINGSWVTIFTKTASSPNSVLTAYRQTHAGGETLVKGHSYEFRIESTGGVEITGFSYEYDNEPYTS